MQREDEIRLRHMLDAAREAASFAKGKSRGDLDHDRQLVLSIVRSVEIVGEAASKVSQPFQSAHPSVPWAVIIGMRNRLIHAYFDVDLDRVWDTVENDVPLLISELEKLL